MSFSTDLQAWSSHKALLGLHDFEINLFENIKRVLSNRIKVDLEYAKNLASLTDNAPRIVTTDFSTPLSLVWGNVLHQYHALSELITNNCMKLNEMCLPKLENLITEKKYSIKSFVDRRNKSSVILQNHEDEVKKNHTNYEKLLQKFNGIKDKLAQLKKGQNTSKADELWCKLSSTASKVHSTHNEYLLSILECNLFQKHHNSVLLPGLLDLQQNFMESSIRHWYVVAQQFLGALVVVTVARMARVLCSIFDHGNSIHDTCSYEDYFWKLVIV